MNKISRFLLLVGFCVLAGCVNVPPPQYMDPLPASGIIITDDVSLEGIDKEASLYTDPNYGFGKKMSAQFPSELRLGVILSENTRKTYEYLKQYRSEFLAMRESDPSKADAVLEDFDLEYVAAGVDRILTSRFKDLSVLEHLFEVKTENVDLAMVFDLRLELGKSSGSLTKVTISGFFVDKENKVIATITGLGIAKVPFPATTAVYKPAADNALRDFTSKLDTPSSLHAALQEMAHQTRSNGFIPQNSQEKQVAPFSESQIQTSQTPPSQDFSRKPVGLRWAVVIGISSYQDTRIPSLRYASRDAKAFYDWLVSPNGGKHSPSRVQLMLDDVATGEAMRDVLFDWLKEALEEDMVTIYFAGHGSPESPDSPENLYLLPYDTKYNSIASTGFPMWDIETALKRFIKAKKVVVIADACHAGGVGQSFDISRRTNRAVKVNPISSGLTNLSNVSDGVAIFSASSDNQFSQESKSWGGGHGVFTYFLLEGLKGKADYNNDQAVNLGELSLFISDQVRRATKNAQAPIVSGKYDPALTIGKR